MRITAQRLFDNAALGIMGQEWRPALDVWGDGCVLETPDGRRCAIGHSVTDGLGWRYSRQSITLANSHHSNLVSRLQFAHDNQLRYLGSEFWTGEMSRIALKFGLNDSVLYFTEAANCCATTGG